jgi:hypothetical protein
MSQGYDDYDVPGGGWLTFAAVLLGFAGTFNIIAGIAAIADSRVYTDHATYVFSNLNTWGWIILILGVLQILAAFGIVAGSNWARWFGIACATLNAFGQLYFLNAYPFWALTMFTVDMLVIYGLAVYGGQKGRTA